MSVEHLSPIKARQILDRVDLLSKIREDILSHPHLEERLLLCQPSADTPEWWQAGKHDKELLLGAAKHGLGRTDITILNDPDFSFHKILGKSIYNSVQVAKNIEKAEKAIKLENRDDILKFDKDEILVKLEKGEGTLKIEKVGIKKDKDTQASEKKVEVLGNDKGQVEMTLVKSESFAESKLENIAANNGLTITTVKAKSPEKEIPISKMETDAEKSEPKEEEEKEKEEKASDEKELTMETDKEEQENEKKSKNEEENTEKVPSEESEKLVETKDEKSEEKSISEKEDKAETKDVEEKKEIEKEGEKSPEIEMEISKEDTEKEKENEKEKEKEKENENDKDNEKEKEIENEKEGEKEKGIEKDQGENSGEEKVKIENSEEAPKEVKVEETKPEETVKEEEVKVQEQKEVDKAPIAKVEDKCSVQAAELKAMFPDLEVIQPLSRLTQVDTFVLRDKAIDYNEPTVAQLLAHSYQSSIKWPKEHAIEARLRHIVHAVEQKEWPVTVNFTAGDETETPNEKDNSEVITITTDHGISRSLAAVNNIAAAAAAAKKRKRHIAIDVETERAKLHALLNSSHMTTQPPVPLTKPPILSGNANWEANEESQSEESRRSTPVQPPPAHQQTRTPAIPFDLKYTLQGKTTVIPGTSSTLTPIDLSAG